MNASNAPQNADLKAEQKAHEPSMEDILASIRKLIADDDALPLSRRATPAPVAAAPSRAVETPAPATLSDFPAPAPRIPAAPVPVAPPSPPPGLPPFPFPAADSTRLAPLRDYLRRDPPAPPAALATPATPAIDMAQLADELQAESSAIDIAQLTEELHAAMPALRPSLEETAAQAAPPPAPAPEFAQNDPAPKESAPTVRFDFSLANAASTAFRANVAPPSMPAPTISTPIAAPETPTPAPVVAATPASMLASDTAPAVESAPAPAPAPETTVELKTESPASRPFALPPARLDRIEAAMLSETSGVKIGAAFEALAESALLRDPEMVERLTREILRPIIKSWLDDNLPNVVERLVRAEIERVARGPNA